MAAQLLFDMRRPGGLSRSMRVHMSEEFCCMSAMSVHTCQVTYALYIYMRKRNHSHTLMYRHAYCEAFAVREKHAW